MPWWSNDDCLTHSRNLSEACTDCTVVTTWLPRVYLTFHSCNLQTLVVVFLFMFFCSIGGEEKEGDPLPNLHLSFSDLFTTEQTSVMQLEHCSSIGNTSMNNNMNTMIHEQQHFHFYLSSSDLFTPEQTSVMQLEHCSSIGNTSMEQQLVNYKQQYFHFHLSFSDLFTLEQMQNCSSIGNTSTNNKMNTMNNSTFTFTWVLVTSSPRNRHQCMMQLEHCSSIGNTSMDNNMDTMNNSTFTFTWAPVISSQRNRHQWCC